MLHSFKIHDDEESFPTIYTLVVDRYKVIIKNNFIFIKSDKNFLELEDFRRLKILTFIETAAGHFIFILKFLRLNFKSLNFLNTPHPLEIILNFFN